MSETVMRVARAIFAVTPSGPDRVAFDAATDVARRTAIDQALAAMAVLRETGLPQQDEHQAEIAQVVSRIEASIPPRAPAGPQGAPPRKPGWSTAMAGLIALATAAAALIFLYWPGQGN